jgi:hypothetical protein
VRTGIVGVIAIQARLDGHGSHPQRLPSSGCLDRLEVPRLVGLTRPDQRVDLGGDLRREGRLEPPFSATVVADPSNCASAHRSQASQ